MRRSTKRLALHKLTLRTLTPGDLGHVVGGLSEPPAHPPSNGACPPSNPGHDTRDPGSPPADPGLPITH